MAAIIHHLALTWAEGGDIDVDDTSAGYIDALEKFWVDTDPEWRYLERTVRYDPTGRHGHDYRGQFDWIATLTVAGERRTLLGDIKTGRYYPHSQTLQLAAYRYAAMTTWDDTGEHVDQPVPTVDGAAVLLLDSDGTYRLAELPAAGEAHSTFLRLVDLHRWYRGIDRWTKDNPLAVTVGAATKGEPA